MASLAEPASEAAESDEENPRTDNPRTSAPIKVKTRNATVFVIPGISSGITFSFPGNSYGQYGIFKR
ncbi:MAG: hypothetical protein OXI53_00100 [Nitrospira sp.]|nr:hypothetical protein [Nitrospira sp.]MDE0485905.1 hypothetical protein [Nitrospira sp.]